MQVMIPETPEEGCLSMVDTAGAEVVVVRRVRRSLATTERRRAVGRPRERALQEVTSRR